MDNRLVLVVEDNPDDVLLLRRAFEKAQVTNPVEILSDGQEALDFLTREGRFADVDPSPPPAVILIDLQLPRVSGLELLQRIREHAELRRVPVVVLTSSRAPRDMRDAYDLGANSYIVKSGRVVEMVRAIQTYWLDLNETAESDTAP